MPFRLADAPSAASEANQPIDALRQSRTGGGTSCTRPRRQSLVALGANRSSAEPHRIGRRRALGVSHDEFGFRVYTPGGRMASVIDFLE
jgi:hypothetical protein